MTMTIDISPEMEAWLEAEAEAQKRGRDAAEYARESFEIWLSLSKPDTEESLFQDMRALSLPTLQEYWINDEDAVYDTL